MIGLKMGFSGQRAHQLVTGYRSPSSRPAAATELKILTKRKRDALGIPESFSPGSGGRDHVHELARCRDNHTCQKCGKVWVLGMRRLDVHHMDEEMDGKSRSKGILKYNRENLDKLITLCHKCHLNLEVSRKRMSNGHKPN
jgi:5-methylcytosine-specific restriction endonuclease McrA